MLLTLFKVYGVGVAFLVWALILNGCAAMLQLPSWYDFLGAIARQGLQVGLQQFSLAGYLWLFIGYPVGLGLGIYFFAILRIF